MRIHRGAPFPVGESVRAGSFRPGLRRELPAMSELFDPYYHWLGIPTKDQPPHHYRLLGIELFEPSPAVVEHAADQRMLLLRTKAAGKRATLSQCLLNEVSAARLCLLDRAQRAAYDEQLRGSLAPAPSAADGERIDGSVLGEYLLMDRLARNASGSVYKARHRTMNRLVALKILSPEAAESADTVERFRRKVRILAALSHPSLVAIHDAGERDGLHYVVMELIDGWDSATLRKRFEPLSVYHAINYVTQAAAGLAFLHERGIVHRNVKPTHLLVDKQGIVKVVGLGVAHLGRESLAAFASPDAKLIETGRVLGTLDYMPPEQLTHAGQVDARADIYSLGCTLHELLTGQPPYPAATPKEKALAHRNESIPSLCLARPDVPPVLQEAFEHMLAKRPDDRFPSMDEVIAALQAALE